MKIRIIAAVFAALTLGGCSYWHGAMSYIGLGHHGDQSEQPAATSDTSSTAAPAAQPAPAPSYQSSSTDDLCRRIAKAAGEQASGEGFDATTQQSKADAAYRNCIGPSAAPAQ